MDGCESTRGLTPSGLPRLAMTSLQCVTYLVFKEASLTIQFSPKGPAFSQPLVDALLNGDVVFLCGAGISAPQLPDFCTLVKRCFERLRMDMSPSELSSFQKGRFEEVLASLTRRIVAPENITEAIVHLLKTPEAPSLENHRTILRLSRNLENAPLVVTTNFDTLLEQAMLDKEVQSTVRELSSAGQDLPAPGSSAFRGIIHLHGRLSDAKLELQQTPLVVTSADYGDAYMRSGWASRFLFDLCRCKTVVLIGYSAEDAPVRYFLNLLEADRQRFPDLRRVYAFDAVNESNRETSDIRWGAIAVEPISYEYEPDNSGELRHTALWRDLAKLADLAERPLHTRRVWAKEILSKSFADTETTEIHRVSWLFSGTKDLWPIAIAAIEDCEWLNFFDEQKLWSVEDAAWIVATWLSKDFQSLARLNIAIQWIERLGNPFTKAISDQLSRSKDISTLWLRAWHLLTLVQVEKDDLTSSSYVIEQSLTNTNVLYTDLSKAVNILTPKLEVRPVNSENDKDVTSDHLVKLTDLVWPSLHLRNIDSAASLLKILVEMPQIREIMGIATGRLQDVVQLSKDFGAINDDYDINDYAVPSVEDHPQNKHHDGLIYLVQLLSQLLQKTPNSDRPYVRALAEVWRSMLGMVGVRLWLHALRQEHLFTADEAFIGADSLSMNAFWAVRRELALVLKERATDANPALVKRIEHRILTQGKDYYSKYSIEEGQADWRKDALDAAVWLRLNMLNSTVELTELGRQELAAIKQRHEHLNRDVEDRDFFGSYTTGITILQRDPLPILQAPEEGRLEVARGLLHSSSFEKREGWNAYCSLDPHGAFETLAEAPLDEANAQLWKGLISSLCFSDKTDDTSQLELAKAVFNTLERATDQVLCIIASKLVDLYWSMPQRECSFVSAWWLRLFIIVTREGQPPRSGHDLYFQAINSAPGRLTQVALLDIEASLKTNEVLDQQLISAIETAANVPGMQGVYSRALLVFSVSFLINIKAEKVIHVLENVLAEDSPEAVWLRSILVEDASVSAAAFKTLHRHIFRGVVEARNERHKSLAVAAKIIRPALSIIREEKSAAYWGITLDDIATCLRKAPRSLREGAAQLLRNWIKDIPGGPALAWHNSIRPLLDEVWPRERALNGPEQAVYFAELAIESQASFPEALSYLLPYLTPVTCTGLYLLERSNVPDDFPFDTLILLWRLFGTRTSLETYKIAPILDRMIKADPQIEFDRRLQWLNRHAMRFA